MNGAQNMGNEITALHQRIHDWLEAHPVYHSIILLASVLSVMILIEFSITDSTYTQAISFGLIFSATYISLLWIGRFYRLRT